MSSVLSSIRDSRLAKDYDLTLRFEAKDKTVANYVYTGGVDGAGFNSNNLNIKSWNGIGFPCSSDDVTRVYISTKLGTLAVTEKVYAGSAYLNKNGDVFGDVWNSVSGPNLLSSYLSATFPTKTDVSVNRPVLFPCIF